MSKLFFPRLAASNLKKNIKVYLPFMLASIGTVMMFYMMCIIAHNPGLDAMSGGESLKAIFSLGIIVIAIFAFIFLFYTNSFLIKQRKKEFGLLNLLGMEKRHIGRMIFLETLYTALICITLGILGGILFSKLMFLLLMRILQFSVPIVHSVLIPDVIATVILFTVLYFLMFVSTLFQVHLAKPVELLKGGQVGEKEPKTKWLLTILGAATLGGGYYLAVTTPNPISALRTFFFAVILVIIGTYCLFTAGSIAVLKLLRRNKTFYYKTRNFISVSGMMYRMKQHAVGLANICILSTMVLVMVSGTVSLYVGMEDVIKNRFPHEIMLYSDDLSDNFLSEIRSDVNDLLKKNNMKLDDWMEYRSLNFSILYSEGKFEFDTTYASLGQMRTLFIYLLDDYNKLAGTDIHLKDNEILLGYNRVPYPEDQLILGDMVFDVAGEMEVSFEEGTSSAYMTNSHFLVVSDMEVFRKIEEMQAEAYGDFRSIAQAHVEFDVDASVQQQLDLADELEDMLVKHYPATYLMASAREREGFFAVYGGLFFLGIFLGTLFMMAAIMIIYYKQMSEGYEDKERFRIMLKVGLQKEEVKDTIQSQVLMVFFAPMCLAVIHILFAFPVITKLLYLLNLTNVSLFGYATAGTVVVYAIIYYVIYKLTAREYYRIVNES